MRLISLKTPLSFSSAFRFPLQNRDAVREVLWGAALLVLLPGIGWLLNMGHRIQMVHQMQHEESAWPAWKSYRHLLKLGFITWLGMVYYYAPGAFFVWLGLKTHLSFILIIGVILLIVATVAIPGYMSHYCVQFDATEIYNPLKALRRCLQGGKAYWRAWAIALTALALSFLGLLVLGIGFFVTSVWFWQVAGYSFAAVFTNRYQLTRCDRS